MSGAGVGVWELWESQSECVHSNKSHEGLKMYLSVDISFLIGASGILCCTALFMLQLYSSLLSARHTNVN